MSIEGPLLRVFEARAKPGCVEDLLANFATTSAGVVQDAPGNRGFFHGRCIQGGNNVVLFVSIWEDLDAVKARFGEDWQTSYLPEGYEHLIENCSVRHFELGSGWNVPGAPT